MYVLDEAASESQQPQLALAGLHEKQFFEFRPSSREKRPEYAPGTRQLRLLWIFMNPQKNDIRTNCTTSTAEHTELLCILYLMVAAEVVECESSDIRGYFLEVARGYLRKLTLES